MYAEERFNENFYRDNFGLITAAPSDFDNPNDTVRTNVLNRIRNDLIEQTPERSNAALGLNQTLLRTNAINSRQFLENRVGISRRVGSLLIDNPTIGAGLPESLINSAITFAGTPERRAAIRNAVGVNQRGIDELVSGNQTLTDEELLQRIQGATPGSQTAQNVQSISTMNISTAGTINIVTNE